MKLALILVFIGHLFLIQGTRIRHQNSKAALRRHVRREMSRGKVFNNANQPLLSYEAQNNTRIKAQIGGSASLKCFTANLGEEMVTWLKRDDEQLLTAGPQVYSSENRYSVSHAKHQKLWELNIRDVRLTDAGIYECQLTTHPPVSILFTLQVVVARSVIKEPEELHVQEGSELRLHCHVENATEPPVYIFWFHNDSMINYGARRPLRVSNKKYGSALTITNVSRSDAGSYRCEPSNAQTDNITLHVIAGENSAAMQKGREEQAHEENSSAPTVLASSDAASLHQGTSMIVYLLMVALLVYSNTQWVLILASLLHLFRVILARSPHFPVTKVASSATRIATNANSHPANNLHIIIVLLTRCKNILRPVLWLAESDSCLLPPIIGSALCYLCESFTRPSLHFVHCLHLPKFSRFFFISQSSVRRLLTCKKCPNLDFQNSKEQFL